MTGRKIGGGHEANFVSICVVNLSPCHVKLVNLVSTIGCLLSLGMKVMSVVLL